MLALTPSAVVWKISLNTAPVMYALMQLNEMEPVEQLDAVRHQRIVLEDRADHFVSLSDEFMERYRLTKDCTKLLLDKINQGLPRGGNMNGLSVPPQLQLLVCLRYLATGSFQLRMADCSQMSKTSVCKFVGLTARAIASLASEYIKFPDARKVVANIQKFQMIAGMPGVIGCVDGSHIPIRGPGGNDAELYRCRKGYFSISMQDICDADLKFMNIIASWPGSVHDSRIFENSHVCHILEQGNHPGYLLGDSGHPCRSCL
ncbi:putative nuclease HARBI1 [Penaeus vannamei]|uniref:putative nuclease HARBI1 n=1 Tax=Penaeus vannamei TaxID=6689 RepID=UPI00387F6104